MNKFLLHIKRFFPFYLVWIFVSVFGVIWEFSILTKPTEEEKVDIFVCADVKDKNGFKSFATSLKPDYLKQVNIFYIGENNFEFSQNLATYGDVLTDIYIMSKEKFDLVTGKDYYFKSFDENNAKSIFGNDINIYKANDLNYAIKIQSEYFNTEELYLGFAKNSMHLKSLADTKYTGAIDIAKGIICR